MFAVQSLTSQRRVLLLSGLHGCSGGVIGVLFGPLIDRFGIKRLYMIALILSAGATLMFALTPLRWAIPVT